MLTAGMHTVLAQEGGEVRTPVWQLGASVGVSATDNAQASPNNQQSGVGTEVGFDARVNLPYRRLRGFADLSLFGMASRIDNTAYSRRSDLRAGLNAEVIESHAFLDVSATYGMQLGSVFDSPERTLLIDNGNRLDVANFSVSPSVRWRLGEGGRVGARMTDSITRVKGSETGDVHSRAGALYLDSGVLPRSSTWKAQAYGAIYDPQEGRRTTEASVRGDVGWAFDAETVVSLVAGREGNDFDSRRRIYNDLYGVSLEYRPNQRTNFYAEALNRFFGFGHRVSLSYRLPQFALIASSSRTNSRPGIGLEGETAVESRSVYDVLFLQLASVEPDVDRRRILVQDLLRTNGIDPTQLVNPSLVTSGVLLTDTQSVSATWAGSRNTVALVVSKGNSRRIDTLVSLPLSDQFQTEERIDQHGAQLIWLRRLAPSNDLSVRLGWSRAEGNLTQLRSTSQLGQVRWSHKIGPRSTLAASLSHERFDVVTINGYRVNVVSCEYHILF